MFLYIVSSPYYIAQGLVKIGCTCDPWRRIGEYQTGYPPLPDLILRYYGIWKLMTDEDCEMYGFEDIVHNHFHTFRIEQHVQGGGTEWFHITDPDPCRVIATFVKSQHWIAESIPLDDVRVRTSKIMRKTYFKNLHHTADERKRLEILRERQAPVVHAIAEFVQDPKRSAGYVIAPCGSGKTVMTVEGLKCAGARRVIICCPSNLIQQQWHRTLVDREAFAAEQVHLVQKGVDISTTVDFLRSETFCVISTYASSHKLIKIIQGAPDVLILDEAHRMVGVVAKSDTGEGRTRKLFEHLQLYGVRRLSLTYTPRFIARDNEGDAASSPRILSMDDEEVFGTELASLKIRDLIRCGVLPDYRLWVLRDSSATAKGLEAKADFLAEAWKATETVRGTVKPILHHLIVFALTHEEVQILSDLLSDKIAKQGDGETKVLKLVDPDQVATTVQTFKDAPRAIVINCRMLGEGVDLPIANAVAITYPKKARGDITQMVLRAGRWNRDKPVFHILLPVVNHDVDDLDGFEEVLTALASNDEKLYDEIFIRGRKEGKEDESSGSQPENGQSCDLECITIDQSDANIEELQRCFQNVRKRLFPTNDTKRIRKLCVNLGLETSKEYLNYRKVDMPDLPEDPRPKGMSWFEFLHPGAKRLQISAQDFVQNVWESNNLDRSTYPDWKNRNGRDDLPTLEHIQDGYFGLDEGLDDLKRLVELHKTRKGKRRG